RSRLCRLRSHGDRRGPARLLPRLPQRHGSMSLREELEDFYAEYSEVIDSGALERWPELFVEPCLYRIVSKENYDKDLPLSLMRCESLGMLKDRAFASKDLNVYAPRAWRHSITQIRAREDGERITARANFLVFETLP